MHHFKLFHSGQELRVTSSHGHTITGHIRKIASHNDYLFIVTSANQLFFGQPTADPDVQLVDLELIRSDCAVVACSVDSIYVADVNGRVQHCPLMAFEFDKRWNDIPFGDNSENVASGTHVRIVEITCNNDGALFVTDDGQLYAVGAFDEVCQSDQPTKVAAFAGQKVLQIEMGDHFATVLTRKCIASYRMLDPLSVRTNGTSNDDSVGQRQSRELSASWTNLVAEIGSARSSLSANASIADGSLVQPMKNDDLEASIESLCAAGYDMIQTQIWCFGSVNKGQLGVGDHVRRKNRIEVTSLRHQGVIRLSTGDEHSAALTLDGRLYLWGDNCNEQISHWLEKEDCSAPKRFYKTEQNVLGVQCGQKSTYVLTNTLERYELSRSKYFPNIDVVVNDVDEVIDISSQMASSHLFLASKKYLVISNTFRRLAHEKYLNFEQQFLQDILQNTRPHLEQFVKQIARNDDPHIVQLFEKFVLNYNRCTELTALNVHTMCEFMRHNGDAHSMAFINHHLEFIHIYRLYSQLYCDIICSDDVSRAAIMPNTEFLPKFSTPILHIGNYIEFIGELLGAMAQHHASDDERLKSVRCHWEQLRTEIDILCRSAERTKDFWIANKKIVPSNWQTPDRRLVLDSKDVPLKLLMSSRFKTNWFVLFNDSFCHSTGTIASFKAYPLETVWVTNVVEKDLSPASIAVASPTTQKHALKIVTPEKVFLVSCQSDEMKMMWLETIEQYVQLALGEHSTRSLRYTTHTFNDKHPIYPSCHYTGQWSNGKMHGYGCLEYPDGRVYIGQLDMNVISGYGRLNCLGSSYYQGSFIDGKFNGFGEYKVSHSDIYEGYFRNGLKHGFGIANENNRAYIGEFCDGLKRGYGVLDDSDSGEKYMGLFSDNVRSGHGFCISVDGKYFEGVFHENELNGTGTAVLTNGAYYDGDLTVDGPNGRGMFYMPIEEHHNKDERTFEDGEKDIKRLIRGNILSGSMNGSWDNVKIVSGNILMDQQYSKYPSAFDKHKIDSSSKWTSLFTDWEQDVFGCRVDEITDVKLAWQKVAQFMRKQQQIEVLRKTIAKSNKFYETMSSGKVLRLHQRQHSDMYSSTLRSYKDYGSQLVGKSVSLSRITGRNYKRNLTAIDRTKSISNEFINNTANFVADTISLIECNNNADDGLGDDHQSSSPTSSVSAVSSTASFNFLEMPNFGITKLDSNDLRVIRDYLTKAFKSQLHPLGLLNGRITNCFYTSYGCWKVKPIAIVAAHAMREWDSMARQIYEFVRHLFPMLPVDFSHLDEELVTHRSLLYPILLSEGVYSTLFVLYANKCSNRDEIYRQRVLLSAKKSDADLAAILKINEFLPLIQSEEFKSAIVILQQVKEKFCPREMLQLIERTFKQVENAADVITKLAVQHLKDAGTGADSTAILPTSIQPTISYQLNADNMMPLSIFLILRADIPHLGTEILMLEDLMGPDFEMAMHGFAGYYFTTIKAAYSYIINEPFLQSL